VEGGTTALTGPCRPGTIATIPTMGAITIRHATLWDLPVLVRQRRQMFIEMGVQDPARLDAADRAYAAWVRDLRRRRRFVAFLAVDGTRRPAAGGALWLREVQPSPGYLGGILPYLMSVYTDPGHRRCGLATRIVRAAIRWSREHGYPGIFLHASRTGQHLYERLGWTRTSEYRLTLPTTRNPVRRLRRDRTP
jgi:GNAT superfamily N-acetyltransferase